MNVISEVVGWVLGKWCYIITTSLKSLNAIYVTLIPNKNNNKSDGINIKDFRHISFVGNVYILIGKGVG